MPVEATRSHERTALPEPLHILAIGAHADDVELFAGGTLALATRRGLRVGIIDLTRGEAATRGTPELRAREAQQAARYLGVRMRENLDLGDTDLANTQPNRARIVSAVRHWRPRLVLTHWSDDRHPDHRRAHELVRDAVFHANVGGFRAPGHRWRVEAMAFFPGNSFNRESEVHWVVDISETVAAKFSALEAYGSQFQAMPNEKNLTYIATQDYWREIERRCAGWGHRIGAAYGEPFVLDRPANASHPLVALLK